MVIEDRQVCPLYPDLGYVTWEEFVNDDGTVERYARSLSGPGNLISREDYNAIENGIILGTVDEFVLLPLDVHIQRIRICLSRSSGGV